MQWTQHHNNIILHSCWAKFEWNPRATQSKPILVYQHWCWLCLNYKTLYLSNLYTKIYTAVVDPEGEGGIAHPQTRKLKLIFIKHRKITSKTDSMKLVFIIIYTSAEFVKYSAPFSRNPPPPTDYKINMLTYNVLNGVCTCSRSIVKYSTPFSRVPPPTPTPPPL